MVLPLDSVPRSPDIAGPPWQKDLSAGGQVPCGDQPAETGNGRSGEEKGGPRHCLPARFPRGHRRQTVTPHTAGARRQDHPGQLSGKAPLTGQEAPRVGLNLRTRETTLRKTDAEPPQSCSKGLLAGYQRFSEGVAERRDADLLITTTFTTGFSRHTAQSTTPKPQDGQRYGPKRAARRYHSSCETATPYPRPPPIDNAPAVRLRAGVGRPVFCF
jgi:hypothetical protein